MKLTLSIYEGSFFTFIKTAIIHPNKIELEHTISNGAGQRDMNHFTLSTEEWMRIEEERRKML